MMTEFKIMEERHPEKLAELNKALAPYLPILINKPAYTTAEAELWFKFMAQAQENPRLALYAINVVIDTLAGWYNENDMNVKIGGTPKRFLKLNFETCEHSGRKGFFATAYEEVHCVTDWCIRLVGFDTVRYTAVLSDIRDKERVMYMTLDWFSAFYHCSMLSYLRKITPENVCVELNPTDLLD